MNSTRKAKIYHRVGDAPEVIDEIRRSGKLKGRAPRNIYQSGFPTVQAYEGPLPKGVPGFEFTTDVPPDEGCPPERANWRAGTQKGRKCRKGIALETIDGEDWAVIEVTVGKVQKKQ